MFGGMVLGFFGPGYKNRRYLEWKSFANIFLQNEQRTSGSADLTCNQRYNCTYDCCGKDGQNREVMERNA